MAVLWYKGLVAGLLAVGLGAGAAQAAGEAAPPKDVDWHHEGPFGTYDRAQLQRGYQVYKEVCAACHSMNYVAFRNLQSIGFTEEQAKAVAAEFEVTDGPDSFGEMFTRPAQLKDTFPAPFPNEEAAKAANGGAAPPDLSLVVKARGPGEDYVYSVLSGYEEGGEHECPGATNPNPYFPGGCIAMPPPLAEGAVEYVDGTPATVDQMSKDVSAFLTWAAEPKMEERKATGLKVIIFMLITCGLLYGAKRRIWSKLH